MVNYWYNTKDTQKNEKLIKEKDATEGGVLLGDSSRYYAENFN